MDKSPSVKKGFFTDLKTNKKNQIIVLVVVAVIVLIAILTYYFMTNDDVKFGDIFKSDNDTEEVTVEDPGRRLDGVIVDNEAKKNIYPTAVMVENISSVRPQAGLSEAGVVYEALAEGGITRFMLVFAGGDAEKIGPVRSARSYYLEWLSEYDAMYAFSGAYPPVLQAVSGLGIKNINAMYHGSKYYWRDSSIGAPHNLFTNNEKLDLALRDEGYKDLVPEYQQWKFKDEAIDAERPTEAKEISIDFSSAGYTVEYKYDKETNTYLRFNPIGVKHTDRNTGEQIAPKNVVMIRVSKEVIDNEGRLGMDVTGQGEAVMFRDGVAFPGTWSKDSRTGRTMYYHEDGTEHEFNRGQTWIEVVPPENDVTYSE